ncbi:MAG: tetraacyldisaccharide 4'-kinase [Veillonella sp.]|uniref:tetraacyldisaccharide 4'-kinase n=1 Tax=Veillonella sp. TaxID=1926307 RepID=UPI0025F50A2B|nr:tetraacyldisaccharide 4'-kinase [Veillonella sp.]MBS4913591.1 tetraacyldisaccharide 4'-kinase [Veillonella sp.]
MKGEAIFKRIISGQTKDPLTAAARGGLGLLSKLYEAGVNRRNDKFDSEEGVTHAAVPVISVGNITAGGTGKTPMVRYVCEYLEQAGYQPSILSRGYKAAYNAQPIVVSGKGQVLVTPKVSGDEPYLLAKGLDQTSVIIGRNRSASGNVAVNELQSDILVLDDGFQHRRLARDLDIVLIDAVQPFGYDHVLPRGLLREPLDGLKRAQVIVLTKTNLVPKDILFGIKNRLKNMVPYMPIFETIHKPLAVKTLDQWERCSDNTVDSDEVKKHRLLAVSGIGSPESFKATLDGLEFNTIDSMDFGDHHDYTTDDLIKLWTKIFATGATAVITTEKDAVKLSQLSGIRDFKIPIYVLPVGIEFVENEQEFLEIIDRTGKKGRR